MRIVLIFPILAISACSPEPMTNQATSAPSPAPKVSPDAPARYVGRWAAKPELCAEGSWNFDALSLSTAGEVACDFRRVQDVPGGFDIDATCHAEGTDSDEVIALRFGASADRMRVESKTFQPIELMRCGGE
jgi:hypothetical protein